MDKQKHKHQINVDTDEEFVTVTIGADGGVPGGFAKLFNRVVDSLAWSRISDAGRAAYLPLVRFADHRNQFRVQMGRAAMMKYTGLSQSAIKRAVKDLIAHKLVVLIELGGVNADGENESNIYQLLVPADGLPKPRPSSLVNPQGVSKRTPSQPVAEPPAGLPANRGSASSRTAQGDHATHLRGVGSDPLLRSIHKENSKTANTNAIPQTSRLDAIPSPTDRAAVLLEEKGVEAPVAQQLAATYPYDRIVDVVAAMEWRRARGKCDNPGGFIRDALVKQWQTPKAVIDARARAQARAQAEEAERQAKTNARREQAQIGSEELQIERVISSLDDDELAILAQSVLEKYQGNAAVTGVLTRKPVRECRLMKMEIAAMLQPTAH